jgi:hypothetical protein
MGALGHNGVELAVCGIDDTTDREPVGHTAFTTLDTLPGKAGVDIRWVDANFDDPFSEKIGEIALTELLTGDPPQIAHIHLTRVVDAHPRPIV